MPRRKATFIATGWNPRLQGFTIVRVAALCQVLLGNRLGHVQGRPVEWRHTLIRGDRFALTAEFSASTGYRLIQPELTSGDKRLR